MFQPENGDRPKKPNYNTFVTDGISTSGTAATEADIPSSADRVIVVALGPNSEPTLKDLATYPDDFIDISLSCNVNEFLKQQFLCEDNKLTVHQMPTVLKLLYVPVGMLAPTVQLSRKG